MRGWIAGLGLVVMVGMVGCLEMPVDEGPERDPLLVVRSDSVFVPDTTGYGEIHMMNGGDGLITWSASSTDSWVRLSPSSGTLEEEIDTIRVTTEGLGYGTFAGSIRIQSSDSRSHSLSLLAESDVPAPVTLFNWRTEFVEEYFYNYSTNPRTIPYDGYMEIEIEVTDFTEDYPFELYLLDPEALVLFGDFNTVYTTLWRGTAQARGTHRFVTGLLSAGTELHMLVDNTPLGELPTDDDGENDNLTLNLTATLHAIHPGSVATSTPPLPGGAPGHILRERAPVR